jgi:outer membrane protein TolC
MRLRRVTAIICLVAGQGAFALTPKQVVESSLKHYPQVIEALYKVDQREGDLQESQGAFDTRLSGGVDNKTLGFYDGDYYTGQIEKAFPFLNSKVYGGYRNSFGSFPVYEGKYDSSTDGQAFAGVSLSLLRNSMIDINRYKVWQREQDKVQSEVDLERVKISVQTLALQAYWTWFVKGYELQVYKEILDLAQQRMSQIERRIKVGDMAQIFRAENNQYIRRRQALVVQGKLEFERASYYLSLFYRDDQGQMISLKQANLPPISKEELKKIPTFEDVLVEAEKNNLDLKTLESRAKQAEVEIQMGRNEILPRVDVSFEYGQNRGVGLNRLSEDEGRVMLNIEVPIEYNRGLGRRRSGRSQLAQIETRQNLVKDQIRTEAQALSVKLNSFAEIFTVTKDEVDLARTLAQAELRKFTRGASDLILVNIREEKLAEAQINNLASLLRYHLTDAEIRRLRVKFLD